MPDQTRNLNSVPDFTGTLDSNDRIIMTDNKASLKALTAANLGKAMIEGYTGSSLAGASQSVKSAIDALNSNTLQGSRGANKNPDAYTAIGYYYNSGYEITLTGLPTKTGYLYVLPLSDVSGYVKQIFMPYNSNNMAIRTQYNDGSGAKWTDWELLPERAEITALNNKHAHAAINGTVSSQVSSSSVVQGNRYGDIFIVCGYIIITSAMVRSDVIATFDSLPSTFNGNYFSAAICTDGTPANICLRTNTKVLDADSAIPAGKTIVFQLVGLLR